MTDNDSFSELLRTPVEQKGRASKTPRRKKDGSESPGGSVIAIAPVVTGLLIGAAIVFGGYLLSGSGNGDTPPIQTTVAGTAPAPPSTTTATIEATAFPTGFTSVNPQVAVRPIRLMQRGQDLYISFATAVLQGLDPEASSGFDGGQWELELQDGSRVTATDEFFDVLTAGAFTVQFALPDGAVPKQVHLIGEALRSAIAFETDVPVEGIPTSLPQQTFPLDGDVSLVIESVDILPEGGAITWRLEGNPGVGASVEPSILIYGEDSNFPSVVRVHGLSNILNVFAGFFDPPRTTSGGTIELDQPEVANPEEILRVEITWNVSWVIYLPTSVAIPVSDLTVVHVQP